MASIDLVCWDFGDTLVDERFMRLAPPGVPDWPAAYVECFGADPSFAERLDLGETSLHDLIAPLAERLGIERAAVARHLRGVWSRIEWFDQPRRWLERLNGQVLQAVVTVNPYEFHGIAIACGLDPLVDVIVTSADIGSLSKPAMALRARELLDLAPGLSTSLLIDNRSDNVGDFVAAGGRAIKFDPTDPDDPTFDTQMTDHLRDGLGQ